MPVPRKYGHQDKLKQVNGLYVHSSPPRVLQVNAAHIKQLVRSGDVEKLENLVYEGQGKKLLDETSSDYKVRAFLKNVPNLMSKISLLHDAVNSGRLDELKSLLEEENEKSRRRLMLAKDESGNGLLHKAVYYDLRDIADWIMRNYPQVVTAKDADGRTPYHYTAMSQNNRLFYQKLLKISGADPGALDNKQHTFKYYKNHLSELELPNALKSNVQSRRNTIAKDTGLNIKKSNIRIWIHQRDLASLQQLIWEGHGNKLLVEHSNNPKVKRFLEAVPHILGAIRDVHADVVNDDLEKFKEHTSPPVPGIIYVAKDQNGLTPLHKAAGLGRYDIAEYIVSHNPRSVSYIDNEGRTPVHYSATLKDGGKMFDYLIEAGADEGALDYKSKSAGFYKTRSNELDTKLLQLIPDCPRLAKDSSQFDWSILGVAATPLDEMAKVITDAAFGDEEEKTETENGEEVNNNQELNGHTEDETKEEEEETPAAEEPAAPEETEEPPAVEEPEETPAEETETNEVEEATPAEESPTEIEPEAAEDEPVAAEEVADEEGGTAAEEEATAKTPEAEEVTPDEEPAEEKETANEEEPPVEEAEVETVSTPIPSPSPTPTENDDKEENSIVEPEATIEGIVNGENEIESVNEEGQGADEDDKDDEDITAMVEAGNMEQLASLVLNGEGDRLIGHSSEVPELQSFLDNVSVYMNKINRIHLAARDGSLKELQAALDRRKFAIAKDKISPNGASPLHVATIFGNTSIVRYLAGRFPETVNAADNNGRSPLHYAAVVPDNGHYYNLLVHLGANTRVEDKYGHTPDFYRGNQGEFSHKNLLTEYGAEELAEDMLNDKDASNSQVEMPFFCTEEGRYLASSLGDPLIKGLTEVANKRPSDPIAYLAQYLYNFANNNRGKSRGRTQESQQLALPATPANPDVDVPANIDVVTLEPDDAATDEDSAFNPTSRDEHGQSMLHFASARSHGRNALFQLLVETEINIGYRDELYRTARDISIQANIPENTVEIDRYVMQIATKGDTDKLVELLLDGYDHIIDLIDEDGIPIIDAVSNANQPDTVAFLHSILAFEERRERVHHAIREGNLNDIKEMLADENDTGSGKLLATGRNSYGRCALHIGVLCQQEEIVDFLANSFPDTLRIGDNLERTALHYAMGIEKIESISRVLIKSGAARILKDLKGRQPTYYFMNKSDILRLQEEEETF